MREIPWQRSRPRSISAPDDALPAPKCSALAPAKNPKSAALPHSLPVSKAQITSSGPPDSGRPDSRKNISTRDISDETNRESQEHPHPQFPTPPASSCDAVQLKPPPSPRSTHADTNIS